MSAADDTLLAAYLDGVAELTPDERRRVEALLANEPALRAEADATRELLGALRELSPVSEGPDWAALERSIRDAVPGEAPRRRWLRWLAPSMACVAAAALAALVLHDPVEPHVAPPPVARAVAPVAPALDELAAPAQGGLWLDGEAIGLDDDVLDALDALDDIDPSPEISAEVDPDLLPLTDEWVDALDDHALAELEHVLDQERSRPRKRS